MAKRMTKAESKALGGLFAFAIVVGLPIYFVVQFGEAIGWHWFAFWMFAGIAGFVLFQVRSDSARRARDEANQQKLIREAEVNRLERLTQAKVRRAALVEKYSDEKIADQIMRGAYWQGQTSEQLLDSLGTPTDTDEKVLKTKKREIWKYRQLTANRYGLRITVENDIVVGWDEKT